MSALERERKKEFEKLLAERENVRVKEQQYLDEIKRMEQHMVEQEKFMAQQKREAEREPNNQQFAQNAIREKELELAAVRGEKVVELKSKRETLENARNRII